jgi:ADP-heptose:LPS heptosyltransferase
MLLRLSRRSRVKKVLVVSLSNIGDVVLTFPVIDTLRETYPACELYVVAGPKAASLLEGNPYINDVFVYDKAWSLRERWRWLRHLSCMRFDLVVDLRNSLLPFVLHAVLATGPRLFSEQCHMREKHYRQLLTVLRDPVLPKAKYSVSFSARDQERASGMVKGPSGYIVIAPGAADEKKRWDERSFMQITRYLVERYRRRIVLLGDLADFPAAAAIKEEVSFEVVNLCGSTTLRELAYIVRSAFLAVTNDSGIMHLASYFNVPLIALFGPTDPFFYGPWSRDSVAIRKGNTMGDIKPQDVIRELDVRLKYAR